MDECITERWSYAIMLIKGVIDEDFVNYKKPSMVVMCHSCTFKCDKENGMQVCQNSTLASARTIEISDDDLVNRYISNPITSAVVIGGLEPFDDINNIINFIGRLRHKNKFDDVVIYTGYTENEVNSKFYCEYQKLKNLNNIIIKFGRYIPNQTPHYDKVLGVNLASDNQYAKKVC